MRFNKTRKNAPEELLSRDLLWSNSVIYYIRNTLPCQVSKYPQWKITHTYRGCLHPLLYDYNQLTLTPTFWSQRIYDARSVDMHNKNFQVKKQVSVQRCLNVQIKCFHFSFETLRYICVESWFKVFFKLNVYLDFSSWEILSLMWFLDQEVYLIKMKRGKKQKQQWPFCEMLVNSDQCLLNEFPTLKNGIKYSWCIFHFEDGRGWNYSICKCLLKIQAEK